MIQLALVGKWIGGVVANVFKFLIENPLILAGIIVACVFWYQHSQIESLTEDITEQTEINKSLDKKVNEQQAQIKKVESDLVLKEAAQKQLQDQVMLNINEMNVIRSKFNQKNINKIKEVGGLVAVEKAINLSFSQRIECVHLKKIKCDGEVAK